RCQTPGRRLHPPGSQPRVRRRGRRWPSPVRRAPSRSPLHRRHSPAQARARCPIALSPHLFPPLLQSAPPSVQGPRSVSQPTASKPAVPLAASLQTVPSAESLVTFLASRVHHFHASVAVMGTALPLRC